MGIFGSFFSFCLSLNKLFFSVLRGKQTKLLLRLYPKNCRISSLVLKPCKRRSRDRSHLLLVFLSNSNAVTLPVRNSTLLFPGPATLDLLKIGEVKKQILKIADDEYDRRTSNGSLHNMIHDTDTNCGNVEKPRYACSAKL